MKHLLPVLFFAATATHLAAQQPPPCTYDRCALLVKQGAFSRSLVRGADETHVASLMFFAPPLDLFAERSDSAARLYASFRRKQNSSTWALLGGVAAISAALVVGQENEPAGISLAVLGAGIWTYSLIRATSAPTDLARAIWLHNRGLP